MKMITMKIFFAVINKIIKSTKNLVKGLGIGILFVCLHPNQHLYAQANISITGNVSDAQNGQPLEFITIVVIEAQQKTRSDDQGNYQINLAAPGNYTIIASSPEFERQSKKVSLQNTATVNFVMQPLTVSGETLTIEAQRDIQKISRNTISQDQIKDLPATFGDSLNALTAFPGVVRTGGFFGSLIIRGAPATGNRYYIDDIPVLNPQHFGAIQSVLSNDIISNIDLYSSAYPSIYGQATGAVIDIQTKDDIAKKQGVLDVSIISSNLYLADNIIQQKEKSYQKGYWIGAGRVSYLTLLVPPVVKLIDSQSNLQLPEYYDYQLKGKYFLDSKARHSVTLFFFGSYDILEFDRSEIEPEEAEQNRKDGTDPLLDTFRATDILSSQTQSMRYQYQPKDDFRYQLLAYNVINYTRFFIDSPSIQEAGIQRSQDVNSKPNIAGLKNKIEKDYGKHRLTLGLDFSHYYFRSWGETEVLTRPTYQSDGPPDFADDSLFALVDLDQKGSNQMLALYAQNRWQWGGLQITPGIRGEYLNLANLYTVDPRILVSYEWQNQTTLSFASGQYSSFAQMNQSLFNQAFNQQPQILSADYVLPERAIHRVIGLERKFELLTLKGEIFYNTFKDLLQNYQGEDPNRTFSNSGFARSKGFELLARQDRKQNSDSLYTWVSYTYTQSEYKSGNPNDPFGDRFYRSPYEIVHSLKLVAGYIYGKNQFSARFELGSGLPFTPIVASDEKIPGRFSPVYGVPYSQRFKANHRLDIRYAREVKYTSSLLTWYIEIINVYNYKPSNLQKWNYSLAYDPKNNPIISAERAIGIIPNFGLQWRF